MLPVQCLQPLLLLLQPLLRLPEPVHLLPAVLRSVLPAAELLPVYAELSQFLLPD
jgi:hypothetical protein